MIGTKRLSGSSLLGPRGRTSVKTSSHGSFWLIPKATSSVFSVREDDRVTIRLTIRKAHVDWIADRLELRVCLLCLICADATAPRVYDVKMYAAPTLELLPGAPTTATPPDMTATELPK